MNKLLIVVLCIFTVALILGYWHLNKKIDALSSVNHKETSTETTAEVSKLKQYEAKIKTLEDNLKSHYLTLSGRIDNIKFNTDRPASTHSVPVSDSINASDIVDGRWAHGHAFMFVYPGDKCPYGTSPTDVPESVKAKQQDSAIYCSYWYATLTFDQRKTKKCPENMKLVQEKHAADENLFFCRHLMASDTE